MQRFKSSGLVARRNFDPGNEVDLEYLKELDRYPPFDQDALSELLLRFQQTKDPAIRQLLVNHNLRLVITVAKKFKWRRGTLSLMDLVSEGNIGLMKGVEKFDPSWGVCLSSYLVPFIRNDIRRVIENQGATIRLPSHVWRNLCCLRWAAFKNEKYFRKPTLEELAATLSWSPAKVRKYISIARIHDWKISVFDQKQSWSSMFLYEVEAQRLSPLQFLVAQDIFEQNMQSLRKLLSGFATGSVSKYLKTFLLRYGIEDGSFEAKSQADIGMELGGITRAGISYRLISAWKVLSSINNCWTEEWLLRLLESTRLLREIVGESRRTFFYGKPEWPD